MWCKNIYDVDLIFWKDIYEREREREREREMTIKPFFWKYILIIICAMVTLQVLSACGVWGVKAGV